ncbi:MAG TPA: heavy metal-associated domain-containing protein, partial [Trebonia sp.]
MTVNTTADATRQVTVAALPSPLGVPDGMREVTLVIGGMTCAACAARIDKKLSRLENVAATVNYATGTARVMAPASLPTTDLIAAVAKAGYTATEAPGYGDAGTAASQAREPGA